MRDLKAATRGPVAFQQDLRSHDTLARQEQTVRPHADFFSGLAVPWRMGNELEMLEPALPKALRAADCSIDAFQQDLRGREALARHEQTQGTAACRCFFAARGAVANGQRTGDDGAGAPRRARGSPIVKWHVRRTSRCPWARYFAIDQCVSNSSEALSVASEAEGGRKPVYPWLALEQPVGDTQVPGFCPSSRCVSKTFGAPKHLSIAIEAQGTAPSRFSS